MADSKEHKYFNNGQKFSTPISELNKIIQNTHVLIMPDQLMEILLPRETLSSHPPDVSSNQSTQTPFYLFNPNTASQTPSKDTETEASETPSADTPDSNRLANNRPQKEKMLVEALMEKLPFSGDDETPSKDTQTEARSRGREAEGNTPDDSMKEKMLLDMIDEIICRYLK